MFARLPWIRRRPPVSSPSALLVRCLASMVAVNDSSAMDLQQVLTPGQFAIDPLASDVFYAAVGGQLLRSTDGGVTWSQLAPGLLSDVQTLRLDRATPT